MQTVSESDGELIARLRGGCETSFLSLYRRHNPLVYRYARHMTGSEGEAEEITQRVFVSLLEHPQRYEPEKGPLEAYLLGMARNHFRQSLRGALVVLSDESLEGMSHPGLPDALDGLTTRETVEAVRAAIQALPPHYREAVILCELEEMDYAAAAQALGCPVGTVRSRLHRARGMLAQRLAHSPGNGKARAAVRVEGRRT